MSSADSNKDPCPAGGAPETHTGGEAESEPGASSAGAGVGAEAAQTLGVSESATSAPAAAAAGQEGIPGNVPSPAEISPAAAAEGGQEGVPENVPSPAELPPANGTPNGHDQSAENVAAVPPQESSGGGASRAGETSRDLDRAAEGFPVPAAVLDPEALARVEALAAEVSPGDPWAVEEDSSSGIATNEEPPSAHEGKPPANPLLGTPAPTRAVKLSQGRDRSHSETRVGLGPRELLDLRDPFPQANSRQPVSGRSSMAGEATRGETREARRWPSDEPGPRHGMTSQGSRRQQRCEPPDHPRGRAAARSPEEGRFRAWQRPWQPGSPFRSWLLAADERALSPLASVFVVGALAFLGAGVGAAGASWAVMPSHPSTPLLGGSTLVSLHAGTPSSADHLGRIVQADWLSDREGDGILAELPVERRTAAQSLALARVRLERDRMDLRALQERGKAAPEVLTDPEVLAFLRQRARQDGTVIEALEVMTLIPGTLAADLLYLAWRDAPENSRAEHLARELLYSHDLGSRTSASLRVALDLWRSTECEQFAAILPRAIEHGDIRAVAPLQELMRPKPGCGPDGKGDCHGCIRESAALQAALQASARRQPPVH